MKEFELVEIINAYLEKYSIRYANEVRMGTGVPDISMSIRTDRRKPIICNYYAIELFNIIKRNKIKTTNEINDFISLPSHQISSYINQLCDVRVIEMQQDKIKILRDIRLNHLGTAISIEAKIKDWRGGVFQAERYLTFSDYVYIALPVDVQKNVDISFLEYKGIGLIIVDGNKLEEVVKPKLSSQCINTYKYMMVSSILKSQIDFDKHRKPDKIFGLLNNRLSDNTNDFEGQIEGQKLIEC